MERERRKRPDDFIRDAEMMAPSRRATPVNDYGMYQKMDAAFSGLHEYLEELRRNYGRIGYAAQNFMSDLSKEYIVAAQHGDENGEIEMSYIGNAMKILSRGLSEAGLNGELPETNSNRFSRTVWQEQLEAELFGRIWPVITGHADFVPELTSWKNFNGNVQAYLYGFLDVVSELGKALTDELSKSEITLEAEFALFERYLEVAGSITLRLSQERHVPGYIISNGYGRWMSYSSKLRTAYGTIAHVRREYNLRLSMRRMILQALKG
ncbi:hypothetical protein KGQ34_00605 [Patescibacteria group bacterium]|nr:hypothetical protein [Patescibacteria group bacterium]